VKWAVVLIGLPSQVYCVRRKQSSAEKDLAWWMKRRQAAIAWATVEVQDSVKDFDWLDMATSEDLMRMAWPDYARARNDGSRLLGLSTYYDPSAPPPDWYWIIGQYQWDD
jgi:hypothetical protein